MSDQSTQRETVIESTAVCVASVPASYGREYTCPQCGNVFIGLNTGLGGLGGENVWMRLTFTNDNCATRLRMSELDCESGNQTTHFLSTTQAETAALEWLRSTGWFLDGEYWMHETHNPGRTRMNLDMALALMMRRALPKHPNEVLDDLHDETEAKKLVCSIERWMEARRAAEMI